MPGYVYRGVFTHFNGRFPAAKCDLIVKESLMKLVGAQHTDEVVCMNGLSVNMHLLLISFYRPTATRYKFVIEGHAFPSDRVKKTNRFSPINSLIIHFPPPVRSCVAIEITRLHGRERIDYLAK